uniref:Uncharacterized protein n=1 Tax=Tolypothrix bouteillei VB521301 TaxID=1479485 RepID=A0A0C1R9U8_9CYAN
MKQNSQLIWEKSNYSFVTFVMVLAQDLGERGQGLGMRAWLKIVQFLFFLFSILISQPLL